jgi:hypothetical protein
MPVRKPAVVVEREQNANVTGALTLELALTASVARYLRTADGLLPRRVTGLYLVGSGALGAFRPSRSDIDLLAVVDRDLTRREVRRLRLLHLAAGSRAGLGALRSGQLTFPGTCNVVFLRSDDLVRPVSEIVPIASHTGLKFAVGRGFDVNPVMWKVLLERGVAVRGPAPVALGLDPQPELLRSWNLDNLDSYWRPWANATLRRSSVRARWQPRWTTAWGVLGAPRLHRTVATGEVISKEAAGEYALDVFGGRWRPIVHEALAYWRGEPPDPAFRDTRIRARQTAAFVLEVVRSAHDL